jgi:plasmid stabilization system protein ParE
MSFAIKSHRLVEGDLFAAAVWFDEQQPGLGDDFLDEAEAVIAALATKALWYAVRFDDVRCVRLKRFRNYGVFYVVRDREIRLLAIHHGARDDRWLHERRALLG